MKPTMIRSPKRQSPTLCALTLLLATTTFGCEAESVDDPLAAAEQTGATADLHSNALSSPELESMRALASRAEAAFIGEVTAIDYQLSEPDEEGRQLPFTVVTWTIEDGIKGVASGTEYAVRFLGGPLPDGKFMSISEIPEFQLGSRDLLFVAGNGKVGCPLVDCAQGRIQLLNPGDTTDKVTPGGEWSAWAAAARDFDVEPAAEPAPTLDLDAPFSFPFPRPADEAELEAMKERLAAQSSVSPR